MDGRSKVLLILGLLVIVLLGVFWFHKASSAPSQDMIKEANMALPPKISNKKVSDNPLEKEIYLAGGCFWGVEEYFSRVAGVIDVTSGYANGRDKTTNYQLIGQTGHAETVHIRYDANQVSLKDLLLHYFRIIDPTSVNKQGNDRGSQYRTGIYYTDASDKKIVDEAISQEAQKHDKPIVVEVAPLDHYVLAEDYHQDYLKKNPNGYCHINVNAAAYPVIDESLYP